MTRLLILAISFFSLTFGVSAWAQSNDAAARALFEDGRALMKEGKHAEACAKFEGSQKLGAKASTALNLGVCYDTLGKFATAWSTFGTAATLARREGHAEREAFARKKMAEMESKLARLTISVGASVDGLQILLDDKPVIAAMIGTALPIDPGTHKLSATAPGKKPWSQDVVIPAEKADIAATVPLLEDAEVAVVPAPTPAAPTPTPTPASTPTPKAPTPASTSPLVYIGFSIGGVGIIVGGIAGIVAIANTSSITDNCNEEEQCPSSERENIDDATTVANVSNVAFAIGAVGVVLGIVGLFLGDDGEPEAAHIEPVIGPGYLGLSGEF